MASIACIDCEKGYPAEDIAFRCPRCGGIYDFIEPFPMAPEKVEEGLPGIWPYRHTFSLPQQAPLVTLGEGNTPLIWHEISGTQVAFKLENLNPTGSFKDRGTAVLSSLLAARGVSAAVEDSSGNAGASFAAYAARTGVQARIFVPAYASGPKRAQIERFGAVIESVPGPRSRAAEAVAAAAEAGAVYASHAYLPQGLPGFSTIAYELVDQLGQVPGSVILPVGHGSLLLGLARGFQALAAAGMIERLPALIGVQASACAPFWQAYQTNQELPARVAEGETLAEGVRIVNPYRRQAVLQAVKDSAGHFLIVEEEQILVGQSQLARRGMDVELTSALVWDALQQVLDTARKPITVILTGHGLKEGNREQD